MYESIGPLHAKAILEFHVFTGCDQIGHFYGKSKLECFFIFTDCQREKLNDFIALRSTESIDSLDNLIEMLQEFVLDLYCRHGSDTVKDIATLWYYLFSKYQKSLEDLHPTVEALRQKVKRSYYVAYVLKHALDAHPFYPDPTSFGWVLSEGTLAPIATEYLPAPSKMTELTMCSCSTNCLTNRCRCKKYNLVCTDICRCCKCENQMVDDSVDKEDYENLFSDFRDDDDDSWNTHFRFYDNYVKIC